MAKIFHFSLRLRLNGADYLGMPVLMSTLPVTAKVLVVDDNPIILRTVYFCLRDHDCRVLMCGDVTNALRHIRDEEPDVVVLDINFPPEGVNGGERDGFWALDWMHRVQGLSDTPVIMISNDDAATARPRALAAGALAFLQKPLDKAELIRLVKGLAARKQAAALA
ncbi:MAG TPA: response regulator [Candidatus Sulfotelmatobacter sp.]|jgi:CheY-like chemotaxis protein|nr:response regulator [Candidatus Sulfotelmatobacter sp.]